MAADSSDRVHRPVEMPGGSARPRHVVFVVISEGHDRYGAMTRIAARSLRVSNPGVTVAVACDRETDTAMRAVRYPLLDEVDAWTVVETPAGPPDFRNRFVKTGLRERIDGPFLYLDSDVLVRGDLGEAFRWDVDVAGAPNGSRPALTSPPDEQTVEAMSLTGARAAGLLGISRPDIYTVEVMGWTIRKNLYLNGGVMFFNDTPGARRFGAEWHGRWRQSFTALSRHHDQPALNAALHATQPRLAVLPVRFNAQFKTTVGAVHGAVVWHYLSSLGRVPDTHFELLVDDLVRRVPLETRTVAAMLAAAHPWRRTTPIDDLAAARILARGRFDGWEGIWLRRLIGQAIRRRGARVVEALRRLARA